MAKGTVGGMGTIYNSFSMGMWISPMPGKTHSYLETDETWLATHTSYSEASFPENNLVILIIWFDNKKRWQIWTSKVQAYK